MPGPAESGPAAGPPAGGVLTRFTPEASAALGGPPWLVERRAAAAPRLGSLSLPTEAEEIWRYSGIDGFDLDAFTPSSRADGEVDLARARQLADQLGPRTALFVTRQGSVLRTELQPGAPDGLVGELAEPTAQSTGESDDGFDVLHQAFVPQVLFISVPAGAVLRAPVVVVHLVDSASLAAPAPACFPHTMVRVGGGAEAGVVEVFAPTVSGTDGTALVVPVSELEVVDGGRLSYANLQILGSGTTQVATQRSRVGRDGSLHSFTVGLGGSYARVRTDSDLVGRGATSALLAAYLGVGTQVHDFRTLQDHHAPHTDSELLFTGAVADQARSVYSGLIRIRHGAKRADARQTNHNLVLSEGAHADSVPNLDIDENDVKCSHASTVGPIDEEQRYYLESRGIEPAQAERLIVLGYFSDMAARSPFPEVGAWVSRSVEQRLAGRLPAERESGVYASAVTGGASGG